MALLTLSNGEMINLTSSRMGRGTRNIGTIDPGGSIRNNVVFDIIRHSWMAF
jgi:hypothetical protein